MYAHTAGVVGGGIGDWLDDVSKFVEKAGKAAGDVSRGIQTVQDIRGGRKQVAVVPTRQGIAEQVTTAAAGIPWGTVAMVGGVGLLAYFLLSKRR
jgi:ElaB/YqjD/DUF883 family membrane-anchored ribosome-binding protein